MIMKSNRNYHQRKLVLIYLSIAFVGMIFIGASLGTLELEPGLPFPGSNSTNPSLANLAVDSSKTVEQSGMNLIILKIAIGIGFLFLSIMIIYSLVRKTNRKNFGILILGLIGLIIIFNVLQLFHPEINIPLDNAQDEGIQLPTLDYEIVPIEQPPSELFWIVGIGLIVGLISVIVFLFFRTSPKPINNDALVEEINTALQAIQDGKELRNIIISCYLQLNQIIKEEYEIERENSLTAREFENHLQDKGIPIKPIHRITSVFEKVRYGNKPTTNDDEQIVIESLVEIRSSCQKKRSGTE